MAQDLMMSDAALWNQNGGTHSNPYYTFSQLYSPKRLKELFKMCEYLFYQSPQIFAALRKFGEYPITEVTYETTNESLKRQHKDLLERVIRVREFLLKCSLDKWIYGNAFITMYQPFVRYLKCPSCSALTNIKHLKYKFNVKGLTFTYSCDCCHKEVVAKEKDIQDRKLMLSRSINFIRWDPKNMEIDHNAMTGESVYYYKIPQSDVEKVNRGHKTFIDTLPIGFLKAIQKSKPFKFADGAIFHMKFGSPAGINPQWGMPPLLPALDRFFYTQILRKANEAIALDHLVPFRILHPLQSTAVADPMQTISLSNWKYNLDQNIRRFRKDPLHIMYSPIPVGVVQVGGQGRALLTLGEVQEAEKSIIAALGIPMEFIYGGLTGQGMNATMRLIENQLETHIADIINLLQWVDDSCAKLLGWEKIQVGLTPFKIIDDLNKQNTILSIWTQGKTGQGPQIISDSTMAEMNDIDLDKEYKRIKQETLDNFRMQQDTNVEIQKMQNAAASQAQQQAAAGGPQQYNQQQIISNADQLVAEVSALDQGSRKSRLYQLMQEDFVLYSVVVQRLEQQNNTTRQQATASIQQQQQTPQQPPQQG